MEIITRMRRQSMNKRKSLPAIDLTRNGLIYRRYKELKKSNAKEWANEQKILNKKEVQMAKKHVKEHSASLAMKEIQIKTTLRFHLTPVRMTFVKGNNNMLARLLGKRNPRHCWWEKLVQPP
jgi:hypothetical protein